MLRFYLIVLISFLPKIAAEAHDDGKIFFESYLRPEEINHRHVRSGNDESANDFSYRNSDKWGQYYPDCDGKSQSPIDIITRTMKRLKVSSPLKMNGYQTTPSNMTVINDGHSVEVSGSWNSDDDLPYISGGDLDGDYIFWNIHFHWSSSGNTGSEHTIDNKSYPLEMHIVHYKREYESPSEAIKHDNGLAIVAFLFEIKESRNYGILTLQKYAEAIKNPNSQIQISPFPFLKFYEYFDDQYISYLGSQTRPPCQEIVLWILSLNEPSLTEAQLDFFRSIELSNGDDHNYRSTMPINDREVFIRL